jgi:hypothetical protein
MASKTVHNTIDDSLLELNRSPFVNIKDFVDACRTRKPLTRFSKWEKFVGYTMKPGKTMDLKYAKKNEFLAPLLQNLGSGANAVNLIRQRGRLLRERAQRLHERGLDSDGNAIPSRGLSDVSASPSVAASGSQSPQTNDSVAEEEEDHEREDHEEDAGDIRLEDESEDEEQGTVYGSDDDEQATVYGDEEAPASAHASSPPSLGSISSQTYPTSMSGTLPQVKQELASASAALEDAMKDLEPEEASAKPMVRQEADKENVAPTASLGKRSRTEAEQQDQPRKKRTRDDLSIGMNGWKDHSLLLRGL